MSPRQHFRAVAIAAAAVLIVASCGDDDDDAGGTTAAEEPAATTGPSTDGADTTSGAATTEGGDTTEGAATTEGGDSTQAPGGEGDIDSVHGQGAAAFQAAMEATADEPLAADDSLEPFVIGVVNLEGDPAGTFPDVHEGAEAAVQLVNERLGGIGADIEAGTGGRPIELAYCGHLVDQNEAQACANQLADANPNMIIPGVDFFTPLMYPLFTDFPVVEMLPIFIADFDQPGVYGIFGGCVTAFPSSAELIAEVKGHDRLAVIWSDNAPGNECWTDTHERFYQYYADTLDNFGFQGFPYTPGDPATIAPAVQQIADYLAGAENPAVHLGAQATDCAAQIQALRAAGVEAQIYTTAACDSEAIRALPESEGIDFEVPGYIVEQPELYDEFIQFELAAARRPSTRTAQRGRRLPSGARCSRRSCSPTRSPTKLLRTARTSTTARRFARPSAPSTTSTCSATSRSRAPRTRRNTNRSATGRPATRSGTGRASPSIRICRTAWT